MKAGAVAKGEPGEAKPDLKIFYLVLLHSDHAVSALFTRGTGKCLRYHLKLLLLPRTFFSLHLFCLDEIIFSIFAENRF